MGELEIDVSQKIQKLEERIASKNQPVKEKTFKESIPSVLVKRLDGLEERVEKLEEFILNTKTI